MKNVRSASSLVKVAGLFVFIAVVCAWQPEKRIIAQNKNNIANGCDTTAPKSADINQINLQLNIDSIMQQVNVALQKIDYQKINADVQKAMAQVDYNKINKEINTAMKNIDWNKMKMNISSSIDSAKMAVDKINWDEMKIEMSKAQEEVKKAMAEQKINTEEIKREVQKSLQEAQVNLQSAKVELRNYKGLQTALMNDGLISKNKPYSIELKEGILYINGIKQSKTITEKYSRFYSGKKNFVLKGDSGTDL